VLLRREGWKVNAKRIYRLYTEEQLIVRTKQRHRIARAVSVGASPARQLRTSVEAWIL
jgi:putative transposase